MSSTTRSLICQTRAGRRAATGACEQDLCKSCLLLRFGGLALASLETYVVLRAHIEVIDEEMRRSSLRVRHHIALVLFRKRVEIDAVAVCLVTGERHVQAVKSRTCDTWSRRCLGASRKHRAVAVELFRQFLCVTVCLFRCTLLTKKTRLGTRLARRAAVVSRKRASWARCARIVPAPAHITEFAPRALCARFLLLCAFDLAVPSRGTVVANVGQAHLSVLPCFASQATALVDRSVISRAAKLAVVPCARLFSSLAGLAKRPSGILDQLPTRGAHRAH